MALGTDLHLLGFEVVHELVLLDTFEKLQRTTISFIVSECLLFLRHHGTNRLQMDGFSLKIFVYFSEICRNISSFIKI
jgi:hypothetical protein